MTDEFNVLIQDIKISEVTANDSAIENCDTENISDRKYSDLLEFFSNDWKGRFCRRLSGN